MRYLHVLSDMQVVSGKAASRLWNEYVVRHHYLGYPLRKNFAAELCQ